MARFARIYSQIRANRLILANRFRGSRPEPLFFRIALRGTKKLRLANLRRFVPIARTCKNKGFILRIDSRESIHANRPNSRCKSPGYLRTQSHEADCCWLVLRFTFALKNICRCFWTIGVVPRFLNHGFAQENRIFSEEPVCPLGSLESHTTQPRGLKDRRSSRYSSGIENFKREWNLPARMKVSSEPHSQAPYCGEFSASRFVIFKWHWSRGNKKAVL